MHCQAAEVGCCRFEVSKASRCCERRVSFLEMVDSPQNDFLRISSRTMLQSAPLSFRRPHGVSALLARVAGSFLEIVDVSQNDPSPELASFSRTMLQPALSLLRCPHDVSGSSQMEDDSSSVLAAAIVERTAGPTNGEKKKLNMVY